MMTTTTVNTPFPTTLDEISALVDAHNAALSSMALLETQTAKHKALVNSMLAGHADQQSTAVVATVAEPKPSKPSKPSEQSAIDSSDDSDDESQPLAKLKIAKVKVVKRKADDSSDNDSDDESRPVVKHKAGKPSKPTKPTDASDNESDNGKLPFKAVPITSFRGAITKPKKKRGASAYNMFMKRQMKKRKDHGYTDNRENMELIAAAWKETSPDTKEKYKQQAKQHNAEKGL